MQDKGLDFIFGPPLKHLPYLQVISMKTRRSNFAFIVFS